MKNTIPIKNRVKEHRKSSEKHDGRNGDRSLIRFTFDSGFGTENGSSSADSASTRSEKSGFFIHLHAFCADEVTADKSHGNNNGVDHQSRNSHIDNLSKSQTEAVKDDAQPQNFFGAERNTGRPRCRCKFAQGIRINNTEQETDDKRAQRQGFDRRNFGDEEGDSRYQRDKENSKEEVPFIFAEHKAPHFLCANLK